ncbi:ribonuclease domain-containing protein [Tsukamurella paurometabola]|uniref:Guanyl-specific ribonuclease Sa n=1 Tax=Tsukamurella paurometabola TaxID=2061 RepID=A0A3P8JZ55_TSUPA|nr:ribonuclease [Tsukamurella paurometabola]UEA81131.1 ribonuclease [Tsukamurella paurometabola]VDR38104.1 Guanyl-specific ribonuclease Sa [Tsukamurella paurometabola]
MRIAPRLAGSVVVALGVTVATVSPATAALPTCALSSLPAEATDTVDLIHQGGPFPYPRNDGVVFQNREGILPAKASGYYHEYTVPTPGSSTRGARRIVTGGTPLTSPPDWYYTGDHYASFCIVTGA